jgi:hypothetical protein
MQLNCISSIIYTCFIGVLELYIEPLFDLYIGSCWAKQLLSSVRLQNMQNCILLLLLPNWLFWMLAVYPLLAHIKFLLEILLRPLYSIWFSYYSHAAVLETCSIALYSAPLHSAVCWPIYWAGYKNIYYKLYLYSWFASKIASAQSTASYISYTEEFLYAASVAYYELMKSSSDCHILDIITHQSSYNHAVITL